MTTASASRSSALSTVSGFVERAGWEDRNSNGGANEGHKSKLDHSCRHFEIGVDQ